MSEVKSKCSKCEEWKNVSAFSPNKGQESGCSSWCKSCQRKRKMARYKELRIRGLCVECGLEKTDSCWCAFCAEKKRKWAVRGRRRLKAEVLNGYGGAFCVCCGETNMEFLSIDHIDGGGLRHTKEIGVKGHAFYRWLRKNNYPTGFRVLCMNCNFARGHYGLCPHEIKKEIVLNWNKEGPITYGEGVVEHASI